MTFYDEFNLTDLIKTDKIKISSVDSTDSFLLLNLWAKYSRYIGRKQQHKLNELEF